MGTYDHFAFQVGDMDAAIQFYVEKLGFTLLSKEVNAAEGEAFSFLLLGDLRLELLQDLRQPGYQKPEIKPPYCPHLAIETDNMQETVAQLKQKGVQLVRGPLAVEGEETWVYFADPDHNILEFIQWLK
jgi:lactoylglutathione lyase